MSPRFKVGQTVYWEAADVMRAEVIEVIPRMLRQPQYLLKWIDENGHQSVHSENKLTGTSFYWTSDGKPRVWFTEHAVNSYRGQR
jgi:hypothetical protein